MMNLNKQNSWLLANSALIQMKILYEHIYEWESINL